MNKKENIKTDDLSFGLYLSKIDFNSLLEHARENILPDVIVDVILEHEHLQNDCLQIIFKQKISLPEKLRMKMLKEELLAYEEEQLRFYMGLLFSKKNIINMLIEYLDEDGRRDLIDTHEEWKKPNTRDFFYN